MHPELRRVSLYSGERISLVADTAQYIDVEKGKFLELVIRGSFETYNPNLGVTIEISKDDSFPVRGTARRVCYEKEYVGEAESMVHIHAAASSTIGVANGLNRVAGGEISAADTASADLYITTQSGDHKLPIGYNAEGVKTAVLPGVEWVGEGTLYALEIDADVFCLTQKFKVIVEHVARLFGGRIFIRSSQNIDLQIEWRDVPAIRL